MAPPALRITQALQDALNQAVYTELETGRLYFDAPENNRAYGISTRRRVSADDAPTLRVEVEISLGVDLLAVTIDIQTDGGIHLSHEERLCLQSNLMVYIAGQDDPQSGTFRPENMRFVIPRQKQPPA